MRTMKLQANLTYVELLVFVCVHAYTALQVRGERVVYLLKRTTLQS